MHAIAYDSGRDRIVVPAQFSQAILGFRGGAMGEEAPVRVIQGPRTGIKRADKIAVDSVNGEIFLADEGSVLVFPADAHGDVAPVRVLRGPATMIGSGIPHVTVDPVSNVLVVSSRGLLIFDRTANGNVAPLRVIKGGGGRLAAHKGMLFATVGEGQVGVWSTQDDGTTAPRFRFGHGYQVRQIAIDEKNASVIVTDRLGAVYTYHVPEVFAPDVRTAHVESQPREEEPSTAWAAPAGLLGRMSQLFR
jgi:hypothetical protein